MTSADNLLGVYDPISELACTSAGINGLCFGEHGEVGFATKTAGSPKQRYWLNNTTASMVPQFVPAAAQKQSEYEGPAIDDLVSFEPSNEQPGAATSEPTTIQDLHFPSWDELPEHLQNATSCADYNSAIPTSTCGVGGTAAAADRNVSAMAWDDMDFTMDMDLDMDIGLDQL